METLLIVAALGLAGYLAYRYIIKPRKTTRTGGGVREPFNTRDV